MLEWNSKIKNFASERKYINYFFCDTIKLREHPINPNYFFLLDVIHQGISGLKVKEIVKTFGIGQSAAKFFYQKIEKCSSQTKW